MNSEELDKIIDFYHKSDLPWICFKDIPECFKNHIKDYWEAREEVGKIVQKQIKDRKNK